MNGGPGRRSCLTPPGAGAIITSATVGRLQDPLPHPAGQLADALPEARRRRAGAESVPAECKPCPVRSQGGSLAGSR
jgi:hypothetical protein